MATTTQNLALIKPAGTDKIRIAQINSNMDTIDAKMGPVGNTSLQAQINDKDSAPTSGSNKPVTSGGIYTEIGQLASAVAILSNNNTHAAITSGQYVYVRGHSTLAEGLYKATAAVAANGALSTSNLTAVSGGGLNAVFDSLNSKVTPDWSNSTSWMESAEQGSANRCWAGKIVTITLYTKSRVHAEEEVIMTLPDGWKPIVQIDIPAYYRSECCVLRLHMDGTIRIWILGDQTNAGRLYTSFTYIRQ